MGHNSKSRKGEISVTNYNGRIRLRWRYQGVRYSLNLSCPYTDYNLPKASIVAASIKLDMIQEKFDITLEKYRDNAGGVEKKVEQVPKVEYVSEALGELVEIFNTWATSVRNVKVEKSDTYLNLRRLLVMWGVHSVDSLPKLLSEQLWSTSTYNGRLSYLRIFLSYAASKGKITCNPLEGVSRRKKVKNFSTKREPLTDAEILNFLEAIKTNRYCPKVSGYPHSHYFPFLYFIFSTGVRNAEAIGLRVKHVNMNTRYVEISEVLARTSKGSNHTARVRKGTKMENTRYIPMPEEILAVIKILVEGKGPEDLVFLSPNGVSIDDRMLQRRVLKPVMKALGYGDKDLYVARHSFGTRAINKGMAPTSTAYLLGHSTVETVMRNYVSIGKAPNCIPTIGKG